MIIEQLYTGCLSEAAYYIESDGEAVIIDPLRDPGIYLSLAAKNKASIRYIFETHFHADFVSGHIELAEKTGATIVLGPTATPAYKAQVARDGETFYIGKLSLKLLHTPGHSLESSCYLLRDETGKDLAVFTGDTLFIDEVGRPDLVQQVRAEITPHFLAGLLYDSLRNKIFPLADDVIVYPGHGKGSPCGKSISEKTSDTIGNQRLTNPAFRTGLTRDEFVEATLNDLPEAPSYFPFNILSNLSGQIAPFAAVLEKGMASLAPDQFRFVMQQEDALVLDLRSEKEYISQHIPGSLWIPFDDDFAERCGRLLTDMRKPLLLVVNKNESRQAITFLSRIGYQQLAGCLKGGLKEWTKFSYPSESICLLKEEQFTVIRKSDRQAVLLMIAGTTHKRIKKESGVIQVHTATLLKELAGLDRNKTYYVTAATRETALTVCALLSVYKKNCAGLVSPATRPAEQKQTFTREQ